jgi:hypothetical protein
LVLVTVAPTLFQLGRLLAQPDGLMSHVLVFFDGRTQAVDDGRVPDDLLGWADCTYHEGHLVAEIQDLRHASKPDSISAPDARRPPRIYRIMLRPTQSTLFADAEELAAASPAGPSGRDNVGYERRLRAEAMVLYASQRTLSLDPSPATFARLTAQRYQQRNMVHGLWHWGRRVAALPALPLPPPVSGGGKAGKAVTKSHRATAAKAVSAHSAVPGGKPLTAKQLAAQQKKAVAAAARGVMPGAAGLEAATNGHPAVVGKRSGKKSTRGDGVPGTLTLPCTHSTHSHTYMHTHPHRKVEDFYMVVDLSVTSLLHTSARTQRAHAACGALHPLRPPATCQTTRRHWLLTRVRSLPDMHLHLYTHAVVAMVELNTDAACVAWRLAGAAPEAALAPALSGPVKMEGALMTATSWQQQPQATAPALQQQLLEEQLMQQRVALAPKPYNPEKPGEQFALVGGDEQSQCVQQPPCRLGRLSITLRTVMQARQALRYIGESTRLLCVSDSVPRLLHAIAIVNRASLAGKCVKR